MRIPVPPIVRPIPLTDYAPELVTEAGAPVTVWAWVNPPARRIEDFNDLREQIADLKDGLPKAAPDAIPAMSADMRTASDAVTAWYAEIWSQHADPATHWTPAEVAALAASDTDPALGRWLFQRTWDAIADHRAGEKKA